MKTEKQIRKRLERFEKISHTLRAQYKAQMENPQVSPGTLVGCVIFDSLTHDHLSFRIKELKWILEH